MGGGEDVDGVRQAQGGGAQGGGERAEVGGEGEARYIHIPPRPDSNMKPKKELHYALEVRLGMISFPPQRTYCKTNILQSRSIYCKINILLSRSIYCKINIYCKIK